jgi:hypothetical protein
MTYLRSRWVRVVLVVASLAALAATVGTGVKWRLW